MNRYMNNTDINEIINHLYISNWETSNNPEIIKLYNIKAVITIETSDKPQEILRYYNENKIELMRIKIFDMKNVNISRYFDSTYDFIKKHIVKHENVLVHCAAGISRSATIILNYMLRNWLEFKKYNLKDANPYDLFKIVLNIAREQRYQINPNQGFIDQLIYKIKEYQS